MHNPQSSRVSSVPPLEEIETNERGGRQTALPVRCDLLPPVATLVVSEVLATGCRKYGPDNWRLITVQEHLNHLITHAMRYLAGDSFEDHLAHLATRALMALEISVVGLAEPKFDPSQEDLLKDHDDDDHDDDDCDDDDCDDRSTCPYNCPCREVDEEEPI